MKYSPSRSLCVSTPEGGISFDLSSVPLSCKRFLTLIFLNHNGLRTPRAVILLPPRLGHAHAMMRFCEEFSFQSVMIRKDVDRDSRWRGGNVIDLDSARRFLSQETAGTTFLCEPFNPLINGHNISYSVVSGTSIVVEVAGPGFDASDLQRGDIKPHQIFYFSLHDLNAERDAFIIDEASYTKSRLSRIRKVQDKYFTGDSLELRMESGFDIHSLVPQSYSILPLDLVENRVRRIRDFLVSAFRYFGTSFTVSSSHARLSLRDEFVEVYWDVFIRDFVK